ncbi:outer membrane beta-barrel protein [Kordia jejudonensis]|uniref:outer membrane beta-barrel protein n=1 Tax=Kordia jejudonensis TaxID=1348245 RepID=UPI00069C2B28|nr:outer membrane beta-barrel protein [Kordia jejudonensis]
MNKNFLTLLLLLLSASGLFAQIKFEKGYFISNNGQKTDCYIKNVDWLNNPTDFTYKLTEDGEIQTGKLVAVKEFVIPSVCKYEKHTVLIDFSNTDLSKLNYDKNPEWKEQTVFLNVLVEGKASLYRYKNGELSKLFYKIDDGQIKQLIKKSYLSKDGKLAENNEYRQQLYTDLACESISRNSISRLRYNKNDITKLFVAYNTCMNDDFTAFKQTTNGKIGIRANIGANYQKTVLETGNSFFGSSASSVDSEQKFSPRIGVDVEYVFGFNKSKWAVFIEPSYQSYKGSGTFVRVNIGSRSDYEIEYSAIQLPIGIRHYMFLDNTSKLFLNFGAIVDVTLNTKSDGLLSLQNDNFKTSAGAVFGIGYSYENTYSIELRYTTPRELLEKTTGTSLKLHQVGLLVGYRFF